MSNVSCVIHGGWWVLYQLYYEDSKLILEEEATPVFYLIEFDVYLFWFQ